MAHSLSAKKRIRQNEARRARNQARRSELKTQIRKFDDAIRAKELDLAESQFRIASKRLDRLATTSVLHRNAAARKKSQLARKLNAAKVKTGA